MPILHRPSTNGHHSRVGTATSPFPGREKLLADMNNVVNESGTDNIEIGSLAPGEPLPNVEGATAAEVAELVDSVKFLVKGWIPFGMLTGIIAEPGIGKSAFALWLARSIVTGCEWFNGRT